MPRTVTHFGDTMSQNRAIDRSAAGEVNDEYSVFRSERIPMNDGKAPEDRRSPKPDGMYLRCSRRGNEAAHVGLISASLPRRLRPKVLDCACPLALFVALSNETESDWLCATASEKQKLSVS